MECTCTGSHASHELLCAVHGPGLGPNGERNGAWAAKGVVVEPQLAAQYGAAPRPGRPFGSAT